MNLKPTDMRLLNYLYHNQREPLTKIAKAAKLSREQAEYRSKKYLQIGLIKRFMKIFNYCCIDLVPFRRISKCT